MFKVMLFYTNLTVVVVLSINYRILTHIIIIIMEMTTFCILAIVAGSFLVAANEKPRLKYVDPIHPCRKSKAVRPTPVVKNVLKDVALPDQFIWNNVNGVNYLTN